MAFLENSGLIGINIIDDLIRVVEVSASRNQYEILNLVQEKAEFPLMDFHDSNFDEAAAEKMLVQHLEEIIRKNGMLSQKAVFTLDSRNVLIKKVPVDADLTGVELKEQIQWEAEQYIRGDLADFVLDYNHLQASPAQNGSEVLLVLVRKDIVQFLTRVFSQTTLNLEVIDIDIFAAIRALKNNYDLSENDKVALIDVGKEVAKIVLIAKGDYFLSTEVVFDFGDAGGPGADFVNEQIAKAISTDLRRMVLDHKMACSIEDITQIYFYGDNVQTGLVENLQGQYNIRTSNVNPFRKVRISATTVDEALVRNCPETFAVSVGAALRDS